MKQKTVKILNSSNNELPKYETDLSAGFDVRADFKDKHYISDFMGGGVKTYDKSKGYKEISIEPNGRVLIPTGLKFAIPDGYELQVRPRSGLALKHGISIVNSPGTLDCFSDASLITTVNGNKKIDDLKINDVVLSVNNKTLEIEKDDIVSIINTEEQEVFIIETEDGILEITPNTDVYTKNGLKKANQLTLDDEIIFINK